jgi:hypothetical protein
MAVSFDLIFKACSLPLRPIHYGVATSLWRNQVVGWCALGKRALTDSRFSFASAAYCLLVLKLSYGAIYGASIGQNIDV